MFLGPWLDAGEVVGRVVGIKDGDTFELLVEGVEGKQTLDVRIDGIDAPEKKQSYGAAAKEALSDLIFNKNIRLDEHGVDRFGRTIADVYFGEVDIGLQMVSLGFAWHYVRYAPENETLRDAQAKAMEGKVGLWADPQKPRAPWNFRR